MARFSPTYRPAVSKATPHTRYLQGLADRHIDYRGNDLYDFKYQLEKVKLLDHQFPEEFGGLKQKAAIPIPRGFALPAVAPTSVEYCSRACEDAGLKVVSLAAHRL